MLTAVLAGFLAGLLFLPTGRYLLNSRAARLIALLPFSLFCYFCTYIPAVSAGKDYFFNYKWVPSAGINLSFHLDGLSLLFSLLITGIGTLVFLYSVGYMKKYDHKGRFFAYLSLFMASMLGLVLSDNILCLFVFWELTSICSFFLIGFNHKNQASRKAAFQALSITGGGGFLLLCGFVVIGYITNTYSIQEILQGNPIQTHFLYPITVFFILAGAFTKSAQFPFHFWLPAAMQAPTPVSTYLHSATMVKAGIYLIARLTPVLGSHVYWNSALMAAGGVTMLYGAFHSLFRTDMKGILAYSTISALGMLVFLNGIGTKEALLAMTVFVLVHALYKATLFLVTGIVDLQTGTRNITRLGGLRKVMPAVAAAGLLAALSSAGVPLTFGFVGKELIYESTLHAAAFPWLVTAYAVLTNIMLLVAGFSAGLRPFSGRLPESLQQVARPPGILWWPPLLLGILSVIAGVVPGFFGDILAVPAAAAISSTLPADTHLAVWHGFSIVLLLSALTLAAGIALYFLLKPSSERQELLNRFQRIAPQHLLYRFLIKFKTFAAWYTRTLQNGYLRLYLITILGFAILLIGYRLFTGVRLSISNIEFSEITFYEGVVFVLMVAAIWYSITSRSRLAAVAAMGIVGYAICLIFVFYSAPDLAMTQFTIDTLTVVLFVLVLYRLPPYLQISDRRNRIRNAVIATLFGTLISIIALQVLNEAPNREISNFYGDNAYILGKGKNVVNVILVDFRGLDTLVEITVLTIAAIGVYSLLKLKFLKEEE